MPNQYEQHNHKDNKYTSVQHGHYMLLQLLVYLIFDNLYKFWLQAKYSPLYMSIWEFESAVFGEILMVEAVEHVVCWGMWAAWCQFMLT